MPNHITTILSVEDDGGMSISDIRKAYNKGHAAGKRDHDDEITEAVMPVARAFAAAFAEGKS